MCYRLNVFTASAERKNNRFFTLRKLYCLNVVSLLFLEKDLLFLWNSIAIELEAGVRGFFGSFSDDAKKEQGTKTLFTRANSSVQRET